MSFRTNLIIGGIFIALLAFVYFYEIKGGEQRAAEAKRAKELLSFQDSAVKKLTIDRGDTVVVVEEAGGEWRLVQPVTDLADQQAVQRYLRNLHESERERVVVDSAQVIQDEGCAVRYGLDKPRLRVALELEDGELDPLAFGDDTPTKRYTYVQQRGANPEIFVVRAWRFDNLDKGVFDLRDRRVLPLDRQAVEEIRLSRAGQVIALERAHDETWQLVEPVVDRADPDAVRSLLNRLENGKVTAFVAETVVQSGEAGAKALEAYGLDPARTLEVSLLIGDARAEKRLRIGSMTSAGEYYARDMSAPQVFRVDSLLVRDLDKSLEDLRDHEVLRFNRSAVTQVELSRPGAQAIVVEQDTAGVWSVTAPTQLAARSWEVDGLLTDLESLEAAGFASSSDPAYQDAEFVLEYALSGSDGELARVRFLGNEGGGVFATTAAGSTVYRIEPVDFDNVDLDLDDLAEVAAAEPDTATNSTTAQP